MGLTLQLENLEKQLEKTSDLKATIRRGYHEKGKGKRNKAPAGSPEGRRSLFAKIAVSRSDGGIQDRTRKESDPSETTETLTEVIP